MVTDSNHVDYYRYLKLKFETIQTSEQRKLLLEQGIDLIGYLESHSYLAALPHTVALNNISGLLQWDTIAAEQKLSRSLANNTYPNHALDEEGSVLLHIYPFRHASKVSLSIELLESGIEILEAGDNYFKVAVLPESILALAALPSVFYLECIPAVPRYEGVAGRQQQRGNWLSLGPGTGLDGSGVALAIGDDGGVDHIDFAGRVFDHTEFDRGSHGDMTAGLAIGGGNLDPKAMGIAPAALLHLYNIEQYEHIDQAVNNYQELGTVITSTSFWEGCGGDYTQAARELDLQVNHSISLLHCFSAGNQGDTDCDNPYGSIELPNGVRFGNITGGRKAAKHSIAVANISQHDSLILNSSRGPAIDGRIKPDLAASGSGQRTTDQANSYQVASGTSAA
ncbi:MAG: S8 family serine peptidase, partial [Saprospiraceae bacterium]|nr:S8 family serine peptidase [Saprospiraceae bacterium]